MIKIDDLVLLDLNEVSERLGLRPRKVRRLVHSEALAAVFHGGRWWVAEEEVQRLLGRLEASLAG